MTGVSETSTRARGLPLPEQTATAPPRRWRLRGRSWLDHLPDRAVRPGCECRDPFREMATAHPEVLLDVRGLPENGRDGLTLARLESLAPGGRLRQLTTTVPWPLFAMLETRGYRYCLVERNPGNVQVVIWRLAGS